MTGSAAGGRVREVQARVFDPLRNQYRMRCPDSDEGSSWVSVSNFRIVRRLRGATHPAVFRVSFDCDACGGQHEALVTHDRLDWEPLGVDATQSFTNLLTGSRELLGAELGELAALMLRNGRWPWSFYCHPESAVRPGFPSSLRMVAAPEGDHPSLETGERIGVMVRCFSCERLSVNFVSREHLDVPFHNDRRIGFVGEVFERDRGSVTAEEAFRQQLSSPRYAERWLGIDQAS